jgi:hypothetical protein
LQKNGCAIATQDCFLACSLTIWTYCARQHISYAQQYRKRRFLAAISRLQPRRPNVQGRLSIMKKRILAALLAACAAAAGAGPSTIEPEQLVGEMEQVRAKALAGDYHAQRKLAYAYVTGEQLQGKRFPMASCAWYLSIPYLNTQYFNVSDSGNIHSTCSSLPSDQFYAAVRYSAAIVNAAKTSGR